MGKTTSIALAFVTGALLLACLLPPADADGIPLVETELHSTLRENRQIAYVSVDEDARTETLDLYLSIVSLEPGNDITVMIPLRTEPYSVTGEETTENRFRQERGYNAIMSLAEKQNHALSELGSEFAGSCANLGRSQLTGILGLMVMGVGSTDGPVFTITDGVSVELLSFNTSESLSDFYESNGMDVPDDVREMIGRYGDFHVGLLHAETRPPIERAKFDMLVQNCPAQLDRFRDFVAANPTITAYGFVDGYVGYFDTPFVDSDLSAILGSIRDSSLRYIFAELIAATYGQGTTQGTVISFRLPLKDHLAFFPLGTTPAWSGVDRTQVIFDIDDNLMIDFDRKSDEVFSDGRHYYVWDFGSGSPDYDLEGTVKIASLGTDLNRLGRQAEHYIYERSGGIGLAGAVILYVSMWAFGLWAFSRLRHWGPIDKRGLLEIAVIGALGFMASLVLTVFVGAWVAVAGIAVLECRYLPRSRRLIKLPEAGRLLTVVLGFLLLLNAIFCSAGFVFIGDSELSLPLLTGFAGTAMIMLHMLLSHNSSPEVRIGAWFLYLALMAPSFFMIVSNAGFFDYCTMAFIIFFLIQTALYMQLVRVNMERISDAAIEWRVGSQ